MFQKAKRLMKKLSSAKEKMQMFMLMMLCGPTAVMAQNSAGDYSAGTTALATVTEEIAKYASVIDQKDFRKAIILDFLKVCPDCGEIVLCHRRGRCDCGCDQRLYRHEQRGAGCQEEDHDGRGRLYFPYRCGSGLAAVLRYRRLNLTCDASQGRTLSRLPAV